MGTYSLYLEVVIKPVLTGPLPLFQLHPRNHDTASFLCRCQRVSQRAEGRSGAGLWGLWLL